MFCKNCGSTMDDNAIICVNCGAEKSMGKQFCYHCGAKVEEGQFACKNCGYAIQKEKRKLELNKKTIISISFTILIVIASIIIIAVLSNRNKSPKINFQSIYDEYCQSTWAEIADDNSYLYVDTNPYDFEDDNFIEAYYAIEKINNALGLPSSLFKSMGETSSIDGRQTETYEDLKIEVTWKYHPDYGLEVTYKKLK